jgi:CTP synthase
MNPTEHGEVFVLESGLETDQDMGNYERFLNRSLGNEDYMTSGMVYKTVIENERALKYGGICVEAIPHVRDEIIRRIEAAAENNGTQITVVEIGGTVGDFANTLYIEAARLLKLRHPDDVVFVMVSYMPVPGTLGEMKTKPTQNAVRSLNTYGVQPDFLIARGTHPLDQKRKEKLADYIAVRADHIISAPDVESIYDVPLTFEEDKFGELMLAALRLPMGKPADFTAWKKFMDGIRVEGPVVNIGVVGKYFDTGDFVLSDAYLSVIEAIKYSGAALKVKPKITWINSKHFEDGEADVSMLSQFDGVIVPGGFGQSGIEGKIKAIQYCRENKVPYFGLCYGMQLAVIETARNVAGLEGANTVEIDPAAAHPIVHVMDSQKGVIAEGNYGGTMRLGLYPAELKEGSIAREAYGAASIQERHRHRYEINPAYVPQVEAAGMVFSGKSPDGVLMEIAELPREVHPFFVGTQFHPELIARPLSPHPLFTAFLKAAQQKKG